MGNKIVVNLGVQRFDKVIEEKKFYIDKTGFIKEWWETGADVTIITRPRRFGKTLNMSMVACFFSNQYAGRGDLFEGLNIWKEASYRTLQGTFPVIFLSFAGIEAGRYEDMEYMIFGEIAKLYGENRFLLEGNLLNKEEREYFENIKSTMESKVAVGAIKRMSGFLQRYYNKDVIIILDEYDTPMQAAWLSGYWDKAVCFFCMLFGSTFKNNPYLYRGLITGITRIAKESIFSSMNNPDVITTTSNEYAQYFGFLEEEVFAVLDEVGLGNEKQSVKKWYDGFTFGNYTNIYNPWSIASFIRRNGAYDAYWTNTSSNELVNSLVKRGSSDVKQTMETLLQGGSFKTELDEQIVFDHLDKDVNAIWSLLLATGYLRVEYVERVGEHKTKIYTVSLTNTEVRSMFAKMIRGWFYGNTEAYYNEFINALLNDNVRRMNTFMNKVALNTFSSFDSGNKPSNQAEPERFYHGFVLGMVVSLSDTYKVRSNRESGYGRYDVIIEPLDKKGKAFIFEFKVLDADEEEQTLEDTLANARKQIEEKQYEAELIAEGFAPELIRKYGFAFQGKTCLIG